MESHGNGVSRLCRVAAATAVWLTGPLAAGCGLLAPFDLGALPEGDGDADADAETAADADVATDGDVREDGDAEGGDGGPFEGPGPLTFVAADYALTAEALCDVDGDGRNDNAALQLGAAGAELGLAAFSAGVSPRDDPDIRLLAHLPWVDDRAGPEASDAVLLLLRGRDADDPRDPTDDFSTVETFDAMGECLDGCGEPLHHFEHVALEGGEIRAEEPGVGAVFMHSTVTLRLARIGGQVAPGGAGIDLWVCGAAPIGDLGRTPFPVAERPGITMLNAFVAGSVLFGIPGVPGITPDIDLDEDGLESFEVDDGGNVTACVDGDLTVIGGPDCWEDPRMADAFSLTLRFGGVPALYRGRKEGWQATAVGSCDEPPETSLFDP